MKLLVSALMLLAGLNTTLTASDSIELTNGKTLSGNLAGRQSIYVVLSLSEGQSEVEMRLKPDEIKRILFSDSISREEVIDKYATSDPFQAATLLEKLVRKRLPFMDLLAHSDELLFAMLLESYIQSGRADDALDRAKLWRTKLKSTKVVDQIDELQIIAAKSAGHLDEAIFYSKRWIDSGKPARETALPWSTLAEKSLNEGKIEEALWLALNPIVFTHPNTPRFLENAYEIAVFSAYQLDDLDYALQLYTDMKLRKLSWPIDSERANVLTKLENLKTTQTPRKSHKNYFTSNPSTDLLKVVGAP